MKNALFVSMALGVMIGAVGVSLCKPAQNFVKNSTDAIREEAQALVKSKMQNMENNEN